MNRVEIEQAVLNEIHALPLDKVEATLKFVLSLKTVAKPVDKTANPSQGEGQRVLGIHRSHAPRGIAF